MNTESQPTTNDTWLARAGETLRELPEPGWDAIADTVIHAVRTTARGGWPLTVHEHTPGARPADLITVSDLVLRGALARALRVEKVAVPTVIEVIEHRGELRRLRIELTCRYGTALREVADHARITASSVVKDILGFDVPGDGIDIAVTDIVLGDPTTTTRR